MMEAIEMNEQEMQRIRDVVEAARPFMKDIIDDDWDCHFCHENVKYDDDDGKYLIHQTNCRTLKLREAFSKL